MTHCVLTYSKEVCITLNDELKDLIIFFYYYCSDDQNLTDVLILFYTVYVKDN